MRRHWESMNNDKKKSVAIGRALLSGPYLIWMIGFTIIPLALIFWYGITTKNLSLIHIFQAPHVYTYLLQKL